MSNDEKMIDQRCVECNKIAARLKRGSTLAKGAGIVCARCRERWELLKKSAEMFRAQSKGKNPFGGDFFKDIFGGGNK